MGLRIRSTKLPEVPVVHHRLGIDTELASRKCFWRLPLRYADSIVDHHQEPRLCSSRMARHTACFSRHAGLRLLQCLVQSLATKHAERSHGSACCWFPGDHDRLLGTQSSCSRKRSLPGLREWWRLAINGTRSYDRSSFLNWLFGSFRRSSSHV